MPSALDHNQETPHGRFAIVVARYNESITSKLLAGALEAFVAADVPEDEIEVLWTPGSFEIPIVADRLARCRKYSAVVCLGAVIRGETTHDQHINRSVSHFLMEIGVRTGVPVLFGILTCETMEQAIHRAGGNLGNKGAEAAKAALEMAALMDKLSRGGGSGEKK